MTDGGILDTSVLDRLHEWGGDQLRQQMIDLFIENAPERIAGIRAGLASADPELTGRSAHSLKGSAANLGASAVVRLAGRVEAQVESGGMTNLENLLDELEIRLGETIAALKNARRRDSE